MFSTHSIYTVESFGKAQSGNLNFETLSKA
jgi:hypothetical protein